MHYAVYTVLEQCVVCCSRFVINVPEEESRDPVRLLFQVELAHWFYLDFYCPENPELRTCGIKEFAIQDILFSLKVVPPSSAV